MMSFVRLIEVFDAINHARSIDSSDEFRDGAFQVDDNVQTSKGASFCTYKILKFDGTK